VILRASPLERAALIGAARVAHDYATQREDRLARKIVSELIEALKRGRRR
jgi:hypothetical protein